MNAMMPPHQLRRTTRPRWRRLASVLVAALLGSAAFFVETQPAVAATTPWLTVSGGYASFTVPADHIKNTMGDVSLLVVDGDFGPSFNRSEYGLSLNGNSWTGIIGPLPAGLYSYQLTGDDTKVIKDPTNPTSVTSQPTLSTFLVAGDSTRLLTDVPSGKGGTVKNLAYEGDRPDQKRSASVWTPPGYDARRAQLYPVLFLLSGEGRSDTDWIDLGRSRQILDNLSVQGQLTPMVVVMGGGGEADADKVLGNLMTASRREYRIATDPAHQAVAGLSAGASTVVAMALSRPGRFGYVGSFAGSFSGEGRRDARAVNVATKLLRLYTGNMTDPAYNPTYRLMRQLDRAGIRYEFDGVAPDLGHNWTAWQNNLADFVPRLFRTVPNHGPSRGHLALTREFVPPSAGATPRLTTDANGDTFATVETGLDFAAARHVTLWGNWAPGGSWLRLPLSKSGERWRGTVGPLKPWMYYYQFIVDLTAKKDTSNPTKVTSEPNWSTFLAPGKAARPLTDVPAGKGGKVETFTYTSAVAGQERSSLVWTPPGYDARRTKPYPVLYLQHGGGQNYTDWVEMGRARQILDNAFVDGKLVPMVVVMSNGNVSDFTKELLENIVPAARTRYNISHEPAQQALAGLSMGGFQTYAVLTSHPGEFAYVGTFSAALLTTTDIDAAAINKGTKLLQVYTGDVTDFVYSLTMSTLSTFDTLGIKYQFGGVTQGPHGWDTWQKNLIDFAPRLFR